MAFLSNRIKSLRFVLDVVDRETLPAVPGQPAPAPETLRVLGTTSVEFYDRRDQAFWPLLRLPVIYLGGPDVPLLVESVRDLCALKRPGFAFRSGSHDELVLQVVRQGEGFVVEAGLDLGAYLFETSGLPSDPGRELALFRFETGTAELVVFADQLKEQLSSLAPGGALR